MTTNAQTAPTGDQGRHAQERSFERLRMLDSAELDAVVGVGGPVSGGTSSSCGGTGRPRAATLN